MNAYMSALLDVKEALMSYEIKRINNMIEAEHLMLRDIVWILNDMLDQQDKIMDDWYEDVTKND